MTTDASPPKSSKSALLVIFLTVFIDLLGFGIVLPLLPRYADHFAIRGVMLGLLMSSFSAMQFLFAPLWGRLSDRIGRRPVLLVGLAASTFFYGMFGYATSLGADGNLLGLGVVPWLFITRIGAGIAGATIPTAQAFIADVTGAKDRAKGMALIGAAFGVGFTFGPLLGALFVPAATADPTILAESPALAQELRLDEKQLAAVRAIASRSLDEVAAARRAGQLSRSAVQAQRHLIEQDVVALLNDEQRKTWTAWGTPSAAPGYVASVLSGLALLLAMFVLPESLRFRTQAGAASADSPQPSPTPFRLFDLFSQPAIPSILFTMFLTTFAFAQFESTLSLLTHYLGLSDRYNYFVFAYIGLTLAIAQGGLVRRLLPKWGELRMGLVGTVLMTLGLALIAVSAVWESRTMLYWVLPICVVGFSALNPSLQSLLSRHTEESRQGAVLGVGQSMSALARILGPSLGLPLIEQGITLPYWSAAGLMAVGVFLFSTLRKPSSG